jgi:hypothetical protein
MHRKSLIKFIFLALISVFMLSCGRAEIAGYNAPPGSTLTFPENSTVKTDTPFYLIVTFSVDGTITIGDQEVSGPLAYIQVQLVCEGCTILDKTDGSDYITSDNFGTLQVQAEPYMIHTNRFGFYQLVLYILPPSAFGVDSYTVNFKGQTTYDFATMEVTVEQFS